MFIYLVLKLGVSIDTALMVHNNHLNLTNYVHIPTELQLQQLYGNQNSF